MASVTKKKGRDGKMRNMWYALYRVNGKSVMKATGVPIWQEGKTEKQTKKDTWARLFRAKIVYICGDNDEAGREGVKHTAALLQAAGVQDVRIWTPRHGYKDARQQFHASRPMELMEDIIRRAEPFTQRRKYEYD